MHHLAGVKTEAKPSILDRPEVKGLQAPVTVIHCPENDFLQQSYLTWQAGKRWGGSSHLSPKRPGKSSLALLTSGVRSLLSLKKLRLAADQMRSQGVMIILPRCPQPLPTEMQMSGLLSQSPGLCPGSRDKGLRMGNWVPLQFPSSP